MYLSNINIRHQLFVWIRVLIVAYRHVATCILSAFSASDRTYKHNIQTNVDENIIKARCSAYSLFECGFHEHNGLDPESLLHIYKTYGVIITVLKTSWTTRTLPEKDTKTNPVITDELSGPSRLYTNWNSTNRSTNSYKALTFFNNVCHQGEKKHWEKTCKKTTNREGGIW